MIRAFRAGVALFTLAFALSAAAYAGGVNDPASTERITQFGAVQGVDDQTLGVTPNA